jgi:aryl-alcohol dehydrogenase-like predicted oxidoreductase
MNRFMRMRTLGGTGIKVSTYCLGAMMFGAWGNPDHEESVRIIHAALDAGINFIDTADVYSAGESEEIVGPALRGRRDSIVLATKAHGSMGDDVNMRGNSRRWLVREVENSLRRLGTDYIDLYQIHRPDPDTDIDETLSALSDLVHSGKVRAIGSSTFPAEQIVEAQWAAERRGYVRFRCEQPPYSIFVRGIEASVLPTCQRYGMGVIVWSPLGGSWLTGKIRSESGVDMNSTRAKRLPRRFDPSLPGNAAKLAAVEELIKVAADAGVPLTHLALAFAVGHPGVTSAIIGPRTMDRIDQIVPPGVTLNYPDDAGWQPPALTVPSARRRPAAERAAG